MSIPNVNVAVRGPIQPSSTYKTKVLKGNHSFASQVTEANMKYVIKYNFDLNGQNIEIPEGCILEFDGGSISNGTLTGNNTILIYNQELNTIFRNVVIAGTFIYNTTIKHSGTFAQKPSSIDIYVGFAYFCTDRQTTEGATNGIIIYHKGNGVWVDALGRTVS